jgi:HEAT repeat protein
MLTRAIASVRGANLVVCELAAPTMEWDMGSWGGHTPAVDDGFADTETGEIVRWIRSKHDDPALIEPLVRALSDRDPCVRRLAAPMLGRLEHPRAVQALIDVLNDREPTTRVAALYALGFTKSTRAISPLLDALGDRDSRVRRAAAWAIGRIEG